MCSPWPDIQDKVDQLNVATRWQVTPRNNSWFQLTAHLYLERSTSAPWLWSKSLTEPRSTGRKMSNTPSL